ncbi:hypothetical protein Taro_001596 [Colocasia esculenta]|uniref:Uncharacterized protein n=1 Tax=Colocasia esculenta TaxID=4460 RepID=A0A843TE49_COLES|nr:hypothetical protein [Colocasia esculenta]
MVRCSKGQSMSSRLSRTTEERIDATMEKQNIKEAEEKDKGMDKGNMKDNNVMQPMSGHLGSQAIVQGLLIYLHFSLPFYCTQQLTSWSTRRMGTLAFTRTRA